VKWRIISKGPDITVGIDYGQWSFGPFTPGSSRNGFAFYVQGPDSELRIKDLKLETDLK